MSGRGTKETEKLKKNVEDQMHRLLAQLQDLEVLHFYGIIAGSLL